MATPKRFPPKLKLSDGVLDAIETHAYSNLNAEVGGMLVGAIEDGTTNVVGFVPATNASAEQISLTFTHDVWSDILAIVAKDFPESQIVGWYHTHPSFGLFLSEYDQFIQQNFFGEPGQVALVIDPIAGNRAWFADHGGTIEMFGEQATRRGPKIRAHLETATSPKRSGLKSVIVVAAVALFCGALGWGAAKAMTPPDATKALLERNAAYQALSESVQAESARFAKVLNSPVVAYTVVDGETLESIVLRFYGSDESAFVREVNGLSSTELVEPGFLLLLPRIPNVAVSERTADEVVPPTPPPSQSPSPSATPSVSAG